MCVCVCHHSWIWDHREASKQASDVVMCVCVAFEQSMVFEAGNKHGVCVCCDGRWSMAKQGTVCVQCVCAWKAALKAVCVCVREEKRREGLRHAQTDTQTHRCGNTQRRWFGWLVCCVLCVVCCVRRRMDSKGCHAVLCDA